MKDTIIEAISGITISLAGGVTSFLMNETHTTFQFVLSLVTAGFAGWITFTLCKEFGMSENITAVACGLSGLSGRTVLEIYQKMFLSKVGKLGDTNVTTKPE